MTNTIYFYNTIRDYYDSSSSASSSFRSQQTPQHDGAAEEVIQLEQQQDDGNSTTATQTFLQTITGMNPQQPVRTDDKDLSQKLSSKCVSPTPQSSAFKRFDFAELKTATRNFRPSAALVGTLGSVYKGWVDEHTLTATKLGIGIAISVKFLKQEEFQDSTKWLAEVNYLGKLYHPNLVRLVGYCLEDEHRLLVYEFMSRGSLDHHLFMGGSFEPLSFLFKPLSWSVRMKVALGAAKGLAFLHSAESKVIYRVFNTFNILLDSNNNAKLSDLWFAKDGPTGDKSHISTSVMGTHGYAAPEYLATGLTVKSDVYSFGVVLLEMLSGLRAVDKNRPTGEHSLVEWAKPYLNHKGKIYRVLDSRLEGQYSLEGAQKAANLALQCLSMEGKFRPNMDDVVKALEELQDSKDILPQ